MIAKKPIRVAVSGAAGQIGYSLLFRIAGGEMLGHDQPIILQLLDITEFIPTVQGVVMELHDSAFPLLQDVVVTDDPKIAFADAELAILAGAKPRGRGMERKDLLEGNAKIFIAQGRAMSEVAHRQVKVLIVGNPANTNALIMIKNAPALRPHQICAMMRLDHNRAICQLAHKLNKPLSAIKKMVIWGNHSPTMYPDLQAVTVDETPIQGEIDQQWYKEYFVPTVAKRGAAILETRGLSSAASAATAAIDHMRDWHLGSKKNWVSMGIYSEGSAYDIPADIVCGMPCICEKGQYRVVTGLSVQSDFSQEKFKAFVQELVEERDSITHLL